MPPFMGSTARAMGPNGRKPYIPGEAPGNHQRSLQTQQGEDGLPGRGERPDARACSTSVLMLPAGRLLVGLNNALHPAGGLVDGN